MNDNFYRAFEERYRGPREIIKERLRVYLPFVEPLKALHPDAAAVDLGCGRGEWLELMRDVGIAARGVDVDEGMLAACCERELPVEHAEAVAHLRGLDDNSVAVVSAFHVAEHIPFADLQELVQQALRVLRPGGLLILETPNPENLVVGTSSFYFDPSHLRPLPPQLLSFLPEHYGFARTTVVRLQEPQVPEGAVRLWDVLASASPDYAVVAQKVGITPEQMALFEAAFAKPHGVELVELAERYDAAAAARAQALADELGGRLDTQQAQIQQLGESMAAQVDRAVGELAARIDTLASLTDALRSGHQTQFAALQAERDALRASRCWRVTAPLRWATRPFVEVAPSANAPQPAAIPAPLRPLVIAMERVLRDPQRSYRINQRLLRYPKLHRWLVNLSRRAGIYPGPTPPANMDWTGGAPAVGTPTGPLASPAVAMHESWPQRGDGTGVHAAQRSPLEAAIRRHVGLG